MPRKPQSRGKCQYCGEETAKSGMFRHLAKCEKRAQIVQVANASKQPEETLWHVRVQAARDKDFWLDLKCAFQQRLKIWIHICVISGLSVADT